MSDYNWFFGDDKEERRLDAKEYVKSHNQLQREEQINRDTFKWALYGSGCALLLLYAIAVYMGDKAVKKNMDSKQYNTNKLERIIR